jgi:alpha-L-fucosidase
LPGSINFPLLTNYGQIDILWLDFSYPSMDWGWSKGKGSQDWQGQRLVEMVRELQPAILLNDGVGVDPDFYTPEQLQPAQWVQVDGGPVTWETCQTIAASSLSTQKEISLGRQACGKTGASFSRPCQIIR